MADSGGPRVWNRADVRTVLRFIGSHGSDYLERVWRLMEFVERFPRLTDAPPDPDVAEALAVISPQTKGGEARAASLTPERRSQIAKAAAAARWTPERRAAHGEKIRRGKARKAKEPAHV